MASNDQYWQHENQRTLAQNRTPKLNKAAIESNNHEHDGNVSKKMIVMFKNGIINE
jgi:hypothetical protein